MGVGWSAGAADPDEEACALAQGQGLGDGDTTQGVMVGGLEWGEAGWSGVG